MPRKRGPEGFVPTDEDRKKVERMSAVGIPQEDIARTLGDGGIDPKTLRKHFREELDTAATKANAMVGGTLYNKAISGDTAAAIWWTKTRMKWKETKTNEFTGEGGGPLEYRNMTEEQIDARLAELQRKIAAAQLTGE